MAGDRNPEPYRKRDANALAKRKATGIFNG
jgi:hypothetical protein